MKRIRNLLILTNKFIKLILCLSIITVVFAGLTACSDTENTMLRGRAYRALALSYSERSKIGDELTYAQCRYFLIETDMIDRQRASGSNALKLYKAYTYGEMRELYKKLPADENIDKLFKNKNNKKRVNEEVFYEFYIYWCKNMDKFGFVQEIEDTIYGIEDKKGTESQPQENNTSGTSKDGSNGIHVLYTYNNNAFNYDSDKDPQQYLDKKIDMITASGEILYIRKITSEEAVYSGVYLVKNNRTAGDTSSGNKNKADIGKSLEVMIRSVRRTIPFSEDKGIESILAGNVVNLVIENGEIVSAKKLENKISGKVISIDNENIEIENYGILPKASDFSSYIPGENPSRETVKSIHVGSDVHDFFILDGKLQAALKTGEYTHDKIRVLIMNDNYKFKHHYNIKMISDSDLEIRVGSIVKNVKAGEEFSVNNTDQEFNNKQRMFVTPVLQEASTKITSLKRSLGNPSYGGSFEIVKHDGVLFLINEIDMESYLKKVVPSEMPSKFHIEALKTQAVCARTYACKQIDLAGELRVYGAHADDSINYQVYNNVEGTEDTDNAVDETKGECALYNGKYAETFFYATSAGVSTDAGIWGDDPAKYPYLTSHGISPARPVLNLTTNEEFKAFLNNKEFPAYEKDYPYYRWNTQTTNKILKNKINDVGDILNISIVQRSPGGIAKKMRVDGSSGSRIITGQNSIRAALGDESLIIDKNDKTTISGLSSLPSSFIYIEPLAPDSENVIKFNIYGGGNGHGVGMSQNAAGEMAQSGMDYRQIIDFFFKGVEVR